MRGEGDLRPLPPGAVTAARMLVAARFDGGAVPVRLLDNVSFAEADAAVDASGGDRALEARRP